MRLQNKIALITGASRGLGKAIAKAYAAEGAKVALCARDAEALRRATDELREGSGDFLAVAADVSQPQDVQRLVDEALKAFGRIDVLVNNASILGPRVPIVEYPYEEWEHVLNVNLNGVFLVTQAVVREMMKQRSGSIINVSSSVGRVGKPRWGAYSVSKFGVESLTQMLAEEVKPWGIRVNSVNPGAMRTEMRRNAYPDEDPSRLPLPEEVVPIFVYLASDESRDITSRQWDAQSFRWP